MEGNIAKLIWRLRLWRQRAPLQFHVFFSALIALIIRKSFNAISRRRRRIRLPSSNSLPSLGSVSREITPQVSAPKQFGHDGDLFELGPEVGVGGQGIVYSCTRISTGHAYAAKVISLASVIEGKQKKKQELLLRREINIMKELHHCNIVNIQEAFWENGFCIIVMDLAAGGNLFTKIESEVNAAGDATFPGLGGAELSSKYVLNQLTTGVQYMHSRNIIHRDLKLENVIIVSQFCKIAGDRCELLDIKIADFGLSTKPQQNRRRSRLQSYMTAVGTPAYVAPEVLDEVYDERVDIWSLGVILYCMLCGTMPFEITSMQPHRHKMEVSEIYKGRSWNAISREGKRVVQGLLTVEADKRLSLSDCLRLPWVRGGARSGEMSPDESSDVLPPFVPRRNSSHASFMYFSEQDDTCSSTEIQAVVRQINGCADLDVQHIEMVLRDGSCCEAGIAGAAYSSWTLQPDELIVAFAQDTEGDNLGSGLVFFTSHCQVIALEGSEARTKHRFVAPRKYQIIGLQFENARLVGIVVEKFSHGLGSVAQIGGRMASAVDQVSLKLRDGTVLNYGDMSGGEPGEPHHLRPGEFIFAVEQHFRDRGLGASLAFYTSAGNVVRLSGLIAAPSARVAVPLGSQICGFEFKNGRLKEVYICPENGDLESQRPFRNPSTAILSALHQSE